MAVKPPENDLALEFAAKMGAMLLSSTASASDVVRASSEIARHNAVTEVHADVAYNQVVVSQHKADGPPRIWLEPAGSRVFDYGRYIAGARLLDDHLCGRASLERSRQQLRQLVGAGPRYPIWVSRLAAGTAGATLALLLGAGWAATLLAFLANVGVDWLFARLSARNWPVFFLQILTGVVAVGAAASARTLDPSADGSQVVVAVIILMLSGMTSTGAVQDLITGWYLTGVGRLVEAFVNTIGLIVGIRLAMALFEAIGAPLTIAPNVSIPTGPLWLMIVVSVLVASAFSIYTQIDWRYAPAAALMTCFGWTLFSTMLAAHSGAVWAAGVAALGAGLLAPVLGGWLRIPAAVLTSIAIIPLFPGLVLYRAILTGIGDGLAGWSLVVTALGTALMLACGALFGQYVATTTVAVATRQAQRWVHFLPTFTEPFQRWRR